MFFFVSENESANLDQLLGQLRCLGSQSTVKHNTTFIYTAYYTHIAVKIVSIQYTTTKYSQLLSCSDCYPMHLAAAACCTNVGSGADILGISPASHCLNAAIKNL